MSAEKPLMLTRLLIVPIVLELVMAIPPVPR